jgi:hypothetical protein
MHINVVHLVTIDACCVYWNLLFSHAHKYSTFSFYPHISPPKSRSGNIEHMHALLDLEIPRASPGFGHAGESHSRAWTKGVKICILAF